MIFEIGEHIILTFSSGLDARVRGKHGIITGTTGNVHCALSRVYTVEYCYSKFGAVCGCWMKRAKPPNTITSWSDFPYYKPPKDCA